VLNKLPRHVSASKCHPQEVTLSLRKLVQFLVCVSGGYGLFARCGHLLLDTVSNLESKKYPTSEKIENERGWGSELQIIYCTFLIHRSTKENPSSIKEVYPILYINFCQ
jgi:hypothetical protein